jgi:hypothetical protein
MEFDFGHGIQKPKIFDHPTIDVHIWHLAALMSEFVHVDDTWQWDLPKVSTSFSLLFCPCTPFRLS